jgi:hypothetical protein
MRLIILILPVVLALTTFAAGTPTTRPTGHWLDEGGTQVILRSFAHAPYPHPSRANGFKNAKETFGPEHYQDSTIGIVIPKSFKADGAVNLVVHFHGHRNHVDNVLTRYQMLEELEKSGRNAILIVPQGPLDVPDSGFGKMEDAGGFEAMVREMVEFLHREKKIHSTDIGHITLTAHSGGYNAVSAIVANGGLNDHITDVLLFDASYGGLERYADWISAGKNRRLVSIFTAHLAPANFELLTLLKKAGTKYDLTMEKDLTDAFLKQREALFIHTEDLAHDDVMAKRDYFARFLATGDLPSR